MDRIESSSSISAGTAMACGGWGRCDARRSRGFAGRALMIAGAALVLAACGSPYYTSDPIEAWVVDAENGKPIEGAIVVAHWQLRGATLDSGTRQNQLEVIETVTDRNGRFFIPGFTKINFTLEQLREEDPRVVIFKPGFSIAGGHNSYPIGAPSPGAHRSSPLRGKRIEVTSLSGDMDRYLREL
ncbi:MAG: hypothetical protein ABW071_10955, partial [Casimicrobiaceae bacterium]